MRFKTLILCALLLAGCGERQISIDESAVTDGVTNVLNSQQAAWNRGDIETFMDGYLRSEKLSFVSAGEIRLGWDAVFTRYKTTYDTPEKMGYLTFSDIDVTPVSADAAFVIGRFSLDRIPDNPSGMFTLIIRKFENGWKIVHDHTSRKEQ